MLPTAVRAEGLLPPFMLLIFLTIIVPLAVPSLFHNSYPVPSLALKYSSLFMTTGLQQDSDEKLPAEPDLMSFTITVPEAVPSLFHNSSPLDPSLAEKYRLLFITTNPSV